MLVPGGETPVPISPDPVPAPLGSTACNLPRDTDASVNGHVLKLPVFHHAKWKDRPVLQLWEVPAFLWILPGKVFMDGWVHFPSLSFFPLQWTCDSPCLQ